MTTHKLVESVSFLLMSLPIIAFACLWYVTTFSEKEDWRVGFLQAAILWGSATLLITELLSVFAAIRPATLALTWTLVITYSLHIIRRHILEGERVLYLSQGDSSRCRLEMAGGLSRSSQPPRSRLRQR